MMNFCDEFGEQTLVSMGGSSQQLATLMRARN
jgi:hypothetical protein